MSKRRTQDIMLALAVLRIEVNLKILRSWLTGSAGTRWEGKTLWQRLRDTPSNFI